MASTTPAQTALLDRIRALVADDAGVREVSMFGGRAVMVNDKMIVSVAKTGDLLVRVPPGHHSELLVEPGAAQAEMGSGREMGPGWIHVEAAALDDDRRLSYWVGVALDHNRSITTQGQ